MYKKLLKLLDKKSKSLKENNIFAKYYLYLIQYKYDKGFYITFRHYFYPDYFETLEYCIVEMCENKFCYYMVNDSYSCPNCKSKKTNFIPSLNGNALVTYECYCCDIKFNLIENELGEYVTCILDNRYNVIKMNCELV